MPLYNSLTLLMTVLAFSTVLAEDVRLPPSITKIEASELVYRTDQDITLYCAASGIPKPSYEWLKNGETLNLNAQNILRLGEGDIMVKSAGVLDEGYYQCSAFNQHGKAISNGLLLQRANQADPPVPRLMEKVVMEGQPFHIQFIPLKSVPKVQYKWASAESDITQNGKQTELTPTKRMQWAENGDLYFSYALPEDEIGGRIYKGLTYNPFVDLTAGGSYTKITVQRAPGGVQSFAPRIAFSSPIETIGLEGQNISLRCFFNGYPDPSIIWQGPGGILPVSRYNLNGVKTELTIKNLTQSDAGEYKCIGSNSKGQSTQSIKLVVQAIPVFKTLSDRPHNVNLTEGDDAIFKCNAYAKPEARIQWMINGKTVNSASSMSRVSISSDQRQLTVRSLCKDCTDRRETYTDLMVVQCNASNVYGYAFGDGYINVLKKTTVSLIGEEKYVIEDNTQRTIQFQCYAVSDKSTPVKIRWYKQEGEDLWMNLHHEPPVTVLRDGLLEITAGDNTTSKWSTHSGRYKCVATNNYSTAEAFVTVDVNQVDPVPEERKASILDYWWIFIIIAVAFLIFILLLICCICICRNRGEKYDVDFKERKNGNDPEKELVDSGFQDYQRREIEPFKGSQNSLGSSARLFGDEEASEAGEQSRFLENGSYNSASFINTTDRKKGRSEYV